MCVGLPGRVVDVAGEHATLDVGGRRRRVSIAVLRLEGTPVGPGDWVLASAGLAVRRLEEREAADLWQTLGGEA